MKRLFVAGVVSFLLLPAFVAAQCDGISVVQMAELVVIYHDVEYNCAVYDMTHEVVLEGDVLSVVEVGIADGWADCYCPYEAKIVVGGMAPGQYTLSYAYGEMVAGEDPPVFMWCEMPFTVSEVVAGRDEIVTQVTASGCGMEATSVPDDGIVSQERTWEQVKALYE